MWSLSIEVVSALNLHVWLVLYGVFSVKEEDLRSERERGVYVVVKEGVRGGGRLSGVF